MKPTMKKFYVLVFLLMTLFYSSCAAVVIHVQCRQVVECLAGCDHYWIDPFHS